MQPPQTDPDLDRRAAALLRLRRRREFRTHLFTFVIVNALLWVAWGIVFAATGVWFPWPLFPLFGWGIGLTMHARELRGRPVFTEEEIRAEMTRSPNA